MLTIGYLCINVSQVCVCWKITFPHVEAIDGTRSSQLPSRRGAWYLLDSVVCVCFVYWFPYVLCIDHPYFLCITFPPHFVLCVCALHWLHVLLSLYYFPSCWGTWYLLHHIPFLCVILVYLSLMPRHDLTHVEALDICYTTFLFCVWSLSFLPLCRDTTWLMSMHLKYWDLSCWCVWHVSQYVYVLCFDTVHADARDFFSPLWLIVHLQPLYICNIGTDVYRAFVTMQLMYFVHLRPWNWFIFAFTTIELESFRSPWISSL